MSEKNEESKFVPLHVHSQYSILDATASVDQIAEGAASYKMKACALTDHGALYGAVEFYKACKEKKLKPIIGSELYISPSSRLEKKKEYSPKSASHLVFLVKNQKGYENLIRMSSLGFTEGFYYHPRIDWELLKECHDGLICLSGCLEGPISKEIIRGDFSRATAVADRLYDLFKEDFYLEIQRQSMTEESLEKEGYHRESWLLDLYKKNLGYQEKVNQFLLEYGKKKGVKIVATANSHYMERRDWQAHEVLLNIQSGESIENVVYDPSGEARQRVPNPKRKVFWNHEADFKVPAEIYRRFSDIPEAYLNTLEVADKCHFELDFTTRHYPQFIAENGESSQDFLRALCLQGILKRYTPERLKKVAEIYPEEDPLETVKKRLDYELSVIIPKGMGDYLLIVWDFIHWAKTNDIPMGPGRGSGAGSIVLYLIGITDIEPLRFNLFFERFINPERISYPDIDVDICMEGRSRVIHYVLQKYGKENIAQIITFGTMKAKMVIRDVGRVLNIPLSRVNEIAKLVPDDLNITLEKALEKDPDFRKRAEEDLDAKRIIEMGKILEGSIRNVGVHAAGIIISARPLVDLIPICNAKDSELPVTQYSMKPVEQVGMLKVDFLGLKTLTAIKKCCASIKKRFGVDIDWVNLDLEDMEAYGLLNRGKTMGVFQLESGGMQDLAMGLHLDRFEEIMAASALYRPGPMEMIPSFIERKHGREKIEYDHPAMEEVLKETYGIMVYQEQVQQTARILAGYTLGEGDVLRRAIGKKDGQEMSKQRKKFVEGAKANSIEEGVSGAIFDKMEKFASYGFNKSHAAAYGFLTYVTAFLKAKYPTDWMASLMSCDSHDLSKVAKFIREANQMEITLLSPDVNEAGPDFEATGKGIRFAMSGVKGVGGGGVEAICEERRRGGKFASLYSFLLRMDLKRLNKKATEALIEAGGFDYTGWSRDALLLVLKPAWDSAVVAQEEREKGVISLFSLLGEKEEDRFSTPPSVSSPKTEEMRLFKEKELLGFFLTSHPLDSYQELRKKVGSRLFHEATTPFLAAVIVETVDIRFSSKNQKKFAIVLVSDGQSSIELPIWSDLYEEKGFLLKENSLLLTALQVDGQEKYSCRWFGALANINDLALEEAKAALDRAKSFQKRGDRKGEKTMENREKRKPLEPFVIDLDVQQTRFTHILKLQKLMNDFPGSKPVTIRYFHGERHIATLLREEKYGIEEASPFQERLREDFLSMKK